MLAELPLKATVPAPTLVKPVPVEAPALVKMLKICPLISRRPLSEPMALKMVPAPGVMGPDQIESPLRLRNPPENICVGDCVPSLRPMPCSNRGSLMFTEFATPVFCTNNAAPGETIVPTAVEPSALLLPAKSEPWMTYV